MRKKLHSITLILLICTLIFSCNNRRPDDSADKDGGTVYYQEQYRPQFHFSPETNWMNDPNGLVFFDGEYHLFYQYYPDSTVWGPMHWGHAVSTDLIRWKHLPVALFPDSLGYIFSGSAVVDTKNSSGLGTDENPALIAIFTYHNPQLEKSGSNTFQNQGMAYSTDRGRSWAKYCGNPILKNPGIPDFRDPKVFWNEDSGRWIMILAVHDRVHLYSSANLKEWIFESEFGVNEGAHTGVWECPDLFRLKVQGSKTEKWVMLVSINPGVPNGGSATQYFIGDFNGHSFVPEDNELRWVDWGRDNYAGVSWSNIPSTDGRRLFIGWMSNWDYATVVPTFPWRSAMTIPRELSLVNEGSHAVLISKPVREIEKFRKEPELTFADPQQISGEKELTTGSINLMQSEIVLDLNIEGSSADSIGIILRNEAGANLVIGYVPGSRKFFVDRRKAGDSSFSEKFSGIVIAPYIAESKLRMHLFVDAASIELFVDDGKLVMTNLVFPSEKFSVLKVFSRGGEITLDRSEFYDLESIWH